MAHSEDHTGAHLTTFHLRVVFLVVVQVDVIAIGLRSNGTARMVALEEASVVVTVDVLVQLVVCAVYLAAILTSPGVGQNLVTVTNVTAKIFTVNRWQEQNKRD